MLHLLLVAILNSLLGCGQGTEPAVLRENRCLDNDMDACYEIGYDALHRPRPEVTVARTNFNKACRVHHPKSCFELGKLVRDARGGPRDTKRAAELFGIACNKGDIEEACVSLGMALYGGHGIKPDKEAAVKLFDRTCHAEDVQPMGCAALGLAYLQGDGIEDKEAKIGKKDEDEAERLFRRACETPTLAGERYAPGCVQVGVMYQAKRGKRDENMAVATDFYDQACKIDQHYGCYELAELHEKGDAPDASDEKAAVYFQKTCNIDPTRGCFEAAELMESGRVHAREGEIESLYNLACEHGETDACAKRSLE